MAESEKGIQRRDFLRKAAATGVAAAWAAPLVNTVAATPAFAQAGATPSQGGCFHSLGTNGGCMGACGNKCTGTQCGGQTGACTTHCKGVQNNECCNTGLCNPDNFTCSTSGGDATYTGSLQGC